MISSRKQSYSNCVFSPCLWFCIIFFSPTYTDTFFSAFKLFPATTAFLEKQLSGSWQLGHSSVKMQSRPHRILQLERDLEIMFAMFCYQGLLLLHFSYNQLSLSRRFDVLRILSTNCILNFLQLIFFILLNQIISYWTCLVRLLELTLKDSSVIFINICINP